MNVCSKCKTTYEGAFCPNCGTPANQTPTPQQSNSKKGMAIAALILGILGLLLSCVGIGIIFGIIGLVLGIISISQRRNGKGMAIVGIVLGALSIIIFAIIYAVGSNSSSTKSSVTNTTTQDEPASIDNTNNSDSSVTNSIQEIQEAPDVAPEKDYISVTADELANALSNNSMKAQNDYEKQYLEIYGKLGNIDSDGKYIGIATNSFTLTNIQCYIKSDEQKQVVMQLLKGDEIIVRGYCKDIGEIIGYQIDIESIEPYDSNSASSESTNDDGLTIGQRNALSSAKNYLSFSNFSYEGLISQLEYEKYSHEDAVYAADNCGADWNEQAAAKAKSYLDISSFSRDRLIEQLEYEGFTHEQAEYGVTQNGY